MPALSQKLRVLQNVFRRYWGAKYLPAWFGTGAPVDSEGKASLV